MTGGLDKAARFRATLAKDKKYDGIFYVALKATGLYCRPSCTTIRPRNKHYFFFDTSMEAESHHYQACSQCQPRRLKNSPVAAVLHGIETGAINEKGVHGLADSLHISERHLRRLVQDRTGVSPTTLNNTKRLNAARLLVMHTELPIVDVAFRAEFASLRQFNNAFREAFKTTPLKMRKTTRAIPASQLSPRKSTNNHRKTHEKTQ